MHKYYLEKIDSRIPFTELYSADENMPPGLCMDDVIAVSAKYGEMLNAEGAFYDNVDAAFCALPTCSASGEPLYSLVPVNMLLWTQEIGNSERESKELFSGIARKARKLFSRKSEKHAAHRIKLMDAPVSRSVRDLIMEEAPFQKTQSRNFIMLQALITLLCCAVRGMAEEESELVHETLSAAAPGTVGALSFPTVNGAQAKMYSAIYSENDKVWNIALMRACHAGEAAQLLRALTQRARRNVPKANNGGTRAIARETFFTRLLSYMDLSASEDPLQCMDKENMAGRLKIW